MEHGESGNIEEKFRNQFCSFVLHMFCTMSALVLVLHLHQTEGLSMQSNSLPRPLQLMWQSTSLEFPHLFRRER